MTKRSEEKVLYEVGCNVEEKDEDADEACDEAYEGGDEGLGHAEVGPQGSCLVEDPRRQVSGRGRWIYE